VISIRPKVAELVFQVYGRALHPELFEVHKTHTIKRGDYQAVVQITSAGHLVTFRYQGITLTEVAAAANHPLPQKRRLVSYRLKGQGKDHIDTRGSARYQVSFALDNVAADTFWTYQREFAKSQTETGLLHQFDASGRMALGGLSYINCEARDRSLLIQAFHTFPDDHAIVKTQSLIEVPTGP
jgi:uncharacterized protein (DUF427 family)